jgi:hypothetical protein
MSLEQKKGGNVEQHGKGLTGSGPGPRPDISAIANKGNVHIEHGANDMDMPVAGFSVAKVKRAVAETLNVANDAQAFVNGEKVDSDYILKESDRLEFLKEAGRKGSAL